jgi:hypothetical protein
MENIGAVDVGKKSNYLKLHKGEKMITYGISTRTLFNNGMARSFYLEYIKEGLDTFSDIARFAKEKYGFKTFDIAVPENWLSKVKEETKIKRNEFIWVYPLDTCFPVTYPGFIAHQKYLIAKNHLSYYFSKGKYSIGQPVLTEQEYSLVEDLIKGKISYDEFYEIAHRILFSLEEAYE